MPYGGGQLAARDARRPLRLVISWIVAAASIWVRPRWHPVGLEQTGAAFVVAALIAVLNALLPVLAAAPAVHARCRLPVSCSPTRSCRHRPEYCRTTSVSTFAMRSSPLVMAAVSVVLSHPAPTTTTSTR
jgi:hypothetical protein